jgi:two-component system, oxyanion-binding sensor
VTASLMTGASRVAPIVHAGFIPLTDCAPLVVAKELGFDAAHGIELHLQKEVSWANIRDKAEAGLLDCAIMLAPMPLASTLGLGGRPPVAMIAAMATSLNGNAITVSTSLYDEMLATDKISAEKGGMAAAESLRRVIERRRKMGLEPLTFGMVYPFSSHNYDLRYWLAVGGIDPDNDVNLVVVPPPLIASSLKAGRIDGFCVGEPWNSVAVEEGSGIIVATKSELWARSPEKVLGLRNTFAAENPALLQSLIAALTRACGWLDVPENRDQAASILSRPEYVGISRGTLLPALSNTLERSNRRPTASNTDIVIFSKDGANFPWVSHATWILTQMIRWGQVRTPFDIAAVARTVYRPDLFRSAIEHLDIAAPDRDSKAEGDGAFFGASTFNPHDPIGYLRDLHLRDARVDLAAFEPSQR